MASEHRGHLQSTAAGTLTPVLSWFWSPSFHLYETFLEVLLVSDGLGRQSRFCFFFKHFFFTSNITIIILKYYINPQQHKIIANPIKTFLNELLVLSISLTFCRLDHV